jgi:hypothetical protein
MILAMKVFSLAFDLDAAPPEQEQVDATPPVEEAAPVRRQARRARAPVSEEKIPESKTLEKPDFLQFLGYALCPGNTVFGPWIKYEDYLNIFKEPRWVRSNVSYLALRKNDIRRAYSSRIQNTTWLIKILLSLTYAFMFLTISTCWNPWLIPDGIWKYAKLIFICDLPLHLRYLHWRH